jgi:putative metallohydrolase (TIGR04338 family)
VADSEKQRTYDGEHVVTRMLDLANQEDGPRQVSIDGVKLAVPVEYKFASVESIQQYVDRVLACARVNWPHRQIRPIRVRARQGANKAHYEYGGVIAIPMHLSSWACRELVVLHEVAHHLTPGHGHDVTFRRAMHTLARLIMAPEVGLILQMTWHNQGLKV